MVRARMTTRRRITIPAVIRPRYRIDPGTEIAFVTDEPRCKAATQEAGG